MRVRVETTHGLLDRELDLPPGKMTLAAFTRAVLPLAGDIENLAARRAAALGRRPACARGCGACCRQLVTISPAEAFHLADVVAELPEPIRIEIESRFGAARETLARAGLLDSLSRLDDPALDNQAHYDLAQAYFRLGLDCPFLSSEGACGIYLLRPALCREYLVTASGADSGTIPSAARGLSPIPPPGAPECANPFATPPARLPVAAELSQALLQLSAQLLRRELQPIPLILAPAWAQNNAAAGRRTWDVHRLTERLLLHLEVSIGQQ